MTQNSTCMRENRKFPRKGQCGIVHNALGSPKTTDLLIVVRRVHDETHCSASLPCVGFPNDSSALGKVSRSELLNCILDDSSHSKISQSMQGDFFFSFLHPQRLLPVRDSFLSSLPVSDPTKYV